MPPILQQAVLATQLAATQAGAGHLWGVLAGLALLLLLLLAIWLVALKLARVPPPKPKAEPDPLDRVEDQLRRHPFLTLTAALGAGLLVGRSKGGQSLLRSLALLLEDSLRRR